MKRVLLATLVFWVILLLALGAFLTIGGRDESPPNVADLLPQRAVVAPEDNAYTYFCAATNLIVLPADTDFIGAYLEAEDAKWDAAVADLVAQNAAALAGFKRGLSCRFCQAPEIRTYADLQPYITDWRRIAKILGVKAVRARRSGELGEATDACEDMLAMGSLIQREGGSLLQYLVGSAILEIGLRQTRLLAASPAVSDEQLARLHETLARIDPITQGYARALRCEFQLAWNTVDQLKDSDGMLRELTGFSQKGSHLRTLIVRVPYVYQPNCTKRLFAAFFREAIASSAREFAQIPSEEDVNRRHFGYDKRDAFKPNSLGKILTVLLLPAVDRTLRMVSGHEPRLPPRGSSSPAGDGS